MTWKSILSKMHQEMAVFSFFGLNLDRTLRWEKYLFDFYLFSFLSFFFLAAQLQDTESPELDTSAV